MSNTELVTLIRSTQPNPDKKGRLFKVEFVKKDGSLRTMRARLGLKRNLKGKGRTFDPIAKGLLGVWEANNNYRMINLNTVRSLKLPDGSKHLRYANLYTGLVNEKAVAFTHEAIGIGGLDL